MNLLIIYFLDDKNLIFYLKYLLFYNFLTLKRLYFLLKLINESNNI